jgi:hypothetical protein
MKVRILGLFPICLLLGCGPESEALSRTATSVRNSTERMASSSAAASDARQARILAEADELQRKADPSADLAEDERYEIRQSLGGYAVYDRNNGRTVTIDRQIQSGLSRDQAEEAVATLRLEEQGRLSGGQAPAAGAMQ